MPRPCYSTVLAAVVLGIAFSTTPCHASWLGSLLGRGQPGAESDEFARRTKEVVSAAADELVPESSAQFVGSSNDKRKAGLGHGHARAESGGPEDPLRDPGLAAREVAVGAENGALSGGETSTGSEAAMARESGLRAQGDGRNGAGSSPEYPQKQSRGIMGRDSDVHQADASKAEQSDQKPLPLSDSEATAMVAHELTDVGKPIGPVSEAPTSERNVDGHVDGSVGPSGQHTADGAEEKTNAAYAAAHHTALKERVEDALASLKSLYEAMRTTDPVAASKIAPLGESPTSEDNRTPDSVPQSATDRAITGETESASMPQPSDATLATSTPVDSNSSSVDTSSSFSQFNASARDASTQSPYPPTSSTESLPLQPPVEEIGNAGAKATDADAASRPLASVADQDATKQSRRRSGKSLITSMLSILAGIVFVAAMGLMVTGVAQTNREANPSPTNEPLYPPRGPSFV